MMLFSGGSKTLSRKSLNKLVAQPIWPQQQQKPTTTTPNGDANNAFQNRKLNQSWLAQSFRKAFFKIDQHRVKIKSSPKGVTSSKSSNQLDEAANVVVNDSQQAATLSSSESTSSKRSSLSDDEEAAANVRGSTSCSSTRRAIQHHNKLSLIPTSNGFSNNNDDDNDVMMNNSDSEYENDLNHKISRVKNSAASSSLVNTKRFENLIDIKKDADII
jgi:hypothetical protein